jgi:hypothetical protein
VRVQLLVATVLALRVRQGDLLEQVLLVEGADDLVDKRLIKKEEMNSLLRRSMLDQGALWGCDRPGSG